MFVQRPTGVEGEKMQSWEWKEVASFHSASSRMRSQPEPWNPWGGLTASRHWHCAKRGDSIRLQAAGERLLNERGKAVWAWAVWAPIRDKID